MWRRTISRDVIVKMFDHDEESLMGYVLHNVERIRVEEMNEAVPVDELRNCDDDFSIRWPRSRRGRPSMCFCMCWHRCSSSTFLMIIPVWPFHCGAFTSPRTRTRLLVSLSLLRNALMLFKVLMTSGCSSSRTFRTIARLHSRFSFPKERTEKNGLNYRWEGLQ